MEGSPWPLRGSTTIASEISFFAPTIALANTFPSRQHKQTQHPNTTGTMPRKTKNRMKKSSKASGKKGATQGATAASTSSSSPAQTAARPVAGDASSSSGNAANINTATEAQTLVRKHSDIQHYSHFYWHIIKALSKWMQFPNFIYSV